MTPGAGSLISGNAREGVLIKDAGTTANLVQGNRIGTDVTGVAALGNGRDGVHIVTASGNTVGGLAAGAGNAIAFNGNDGVLVEAGTGNAIQGNSIFASAHLGIELRANGNHMQPAPVLEAASSGGGTTTVQGTFRGAPSTTYTLEFFSNTACNASGFGEGETPLGSLTVTTDADGFAAFTANFLGEVPPGQFITATATDPDNNTSPFSNCVAVSGS
jgi:hypothetical protein